MMECYQRQKALIPNLFDSGGAGEVLAEPWDTGHASCPPANAPVSPRGSSVWHLP